MVEQLLTGENCTICHGGDRHTVQERVYAGTAVPEIQSGPDVMYGAGVACDGCHTGVEFMKTGEMIISAQDASVKQCGTCHGDESYTEMLTLWQEDVKDRLEGLQAAAEALARSCDEAKAPEGETAPARELLAAAQRKLQVVTSDGSYGAHNFIYISMILDGAEEDLEEGRLVLARLKNRNSGVSKE
jgi:hypothetical protein